MIFKIDIKFKYQITIRIMKESSKTYLSNYLDGIKNKKGEYKRVIISPLRYAGGKSKAIGQILENIPSLKEKKIVSPFMGGCSFELTCSMILGYEVIAYDIFGMLVNFWNVLKEKKEEFINELDKFEITKDEFTRNRHILLNYWEEKEKPKDLNYETKNKLELTNEEKTRLNDNNLMQAVYYYYNMTLSYGPMFLGWPSSVEINKDKFKRRLNKLKELNMRNISFNKGDFKEILKNHENDFLFLDPPYYLGEDSKMFKGMYPNCNFAIHHNNFEHNTMCELLKNHKGGFLITYNNCETIRNMYEEYEQVFPEWQYSYGQGETRIGKNREKKCNVSNVKESHEIFIISYPNVV